MGARTGVADPAAQALDVAVGAFVDGLARAGVTDVCACPGSRSAPLAMLLRAHPGIRMWMHLDERSAAYFALGMAKASRRPVALLATSGTAAVNFAPAVVEAWHARVPLVVLTADRPPELRDVGAPQTIDQQGLYGRHVKWAFEMPLPEATETAARHARIVAARAAATAREAPAGPVHLNFPFREPLIPAMEPAWGRGVEDVTVTEAPRTPDGAQAAALARELRDVSRGLIVCGPQDDPALPAAAAALARALGWPLLADPLSQARCGAHDRSLTIDAYDAFLRDEDIAEALRPDAVLRFGALPTSKPLFRFLERHAGARQVVVDGGGRWPDPIHTATDVVHADAVAFCDVLTATLGGATVERDGASRWAETWLALDARTRDAIGAGIDEQQAMSEPAVFAELASLLPDGATLFAGNSMPVRDLDTFLPGTGRDVRFLANRGANGIDGVVSSALGASATCGGPLALALGDLSFYHDMNGLYAAKRHALDATIVLLNNDGGGIFSFLPQAEHPAQFEELFGTPHGIDFSHVAGLYGVGFERVAERRAFREAVARSLAAPGVQVVEVRTDRAENVALHRDVWRAVSQAVAGMV